MRLRPVHVIAAVAVSWGSVGVLVRWSDLPAVAIAGGRVGLAALLLLGWLRSGARRRPAVPGAAVRRPRVLTNGVVLAVHWLALVAALQRAPIGVVLLVTYLAPVGIAALAPAVLGERVPARTGVALALGLGGVALVALPALATPGADGVLLAALAGALMVVLVLSSRSLAADVGGTRLAAAQLAAAAVVLLPVAATADWGPARASWAWLGVLGALTALTMALYYRALADVPAAEAGVLMYLEPASAVLFGWALLGEAPAASTLLGGTLIVAAGALVAGAAPAAPAAPATRPAGQVGVVPR